MPRMIAPTTAESSATASPLPRNGGPNSPPVHEGVQLRLVVVGQERDVGMVGRIGRDPRGDEIGGRAVDVGQMHPRRRLPARRPVAAKVVRVQVAVALLRAARRQQQAAELLVGGDPPPGQLRHHRARGLLGADAGLAVEQVGHRHAVALALVEAPDRPPARHEAAAAVWIVLDRHRDGS